MKKAFFAALAVAALLVPGSTAKAGIGFDTPIDLNFSVFNGGGFTYGDVTGIQEITFDGIVASNQLTSSGASGGVVSNGDSVRTVGGVAAVSFEGGGGLLPSPVGPNPGQLEMTATLDASGVVFNRASDSNFEVFLTDATVKFYVDNIASAGTGNFNKNTATTWNDGTHVATWELINGTGVITFLGSTATGSTEFDAELTANPVAGFITAAVSDLLGKLQMFVTTDDQPLLPIPGTLPTGIDTVFPGFSTNWGTYVDVRADIDGSANFNIVPEPSSVVLMAMGGIALAGVAVRRRRNAKKNA